MNKMRIVAGQLRSRRIRGVEGMCTRPTSDKIKEAIFSCIGPYFKEGDMLDLFAGSGNISFEAISRGIAHSVLCDIQDKAITTIQQNCQSLGLQKQCSIWKMDYKKALKRVFDEKRVFSLMYIDPPYKKQQIQTILAYVCDHHLIQLDGHVVCESLKEDVFPERVGDLQKIKESTYGITRITYYKRGNI